MKALICDVCGSVIDREGMFEHYHVWMKDPQGEHWLVPKKLDICYDCFERLKADIHNRAISCKVNAIGDLYTTESECSACSCVEETQEKPRRKGGKQSEQV